MKPFPGEAARYLATGWLRWISSIVKRQRDLSSLEWTHILHVVLLSLTVRLQLAPPSVDI